MDTMDTSASASAPKPAICPACHREKVAATKTPELTSAAEADIWEALNSREWFGFLCVNHETSLPSDRFMMSVIRHISCPKCNAIPGGDFKFVILQAQFNLPGPGSPLARTITCRSCTFLFVRRPLITPETVYSLMSEAGMAVSDELRYALQKILRFDDERTPVVIPHGSGEPELTMARSLLSRLIRSGREQIEERDRQAGREAPRLPVETPGVARRTKHPWHETPALHMPRLGRLPA